MTARVCGLIGCLLALVMLPLRSTLAAELYASIIIDDLGDNLQQVKSVAALPGPVAIAVMPDTPYADRALKLARKQGKQVLLHMPMQAIEHKKMAPGYLGLHMSREDFIARVRQSLDSLPGVVGLNNHMGSLITRHPGHMGWLMSTLAEKESLLFVDSRTTDQSVAMQIASEYDVPSVQRDVFLDPDYDRATIRRQFDRFISLVRQNGSALAIAHPHPYSLELLRRRLPELAEHGIKLVPLTDYVSRRNRQHVSCSGTACAGM